MKKLLLLLLCMPLLFSCVNEKTNKDDNKSKENNTTKLETTFNGSISVSTSILIEDNMDDNTDSLYHVNMIEESEDNIENVIAILKSYALAKETIESLPFDTSSQTIEELTRKYVNSLQIIRLEDTDVFELSIQDNSIESVNYLNKLVHNYIESDIDRKRIASINTVNFITNRIDQIGDSLSLIDIKLQDYKNNYLIDQKELLNIERMQNTLEQLYIFLLEKKLVAEMTASAITSNIQIIDPARCKKRSNF